MEITILVSFVFLASVIGTITSFGTATVMVPVLGFFYPLSITLLFSGIIHWFGNIWKMIFFRSGLQVKLILLFGLPGIVASYFGAQLVPNISEVLLQRMLGIFLLGYVLFLFKHATWKISANSPNALLGGLLSGLSSGIFGVGGAIRAGFYRPII